MRKLITALAFCLLASSASGQELSTLLDDTFVRSGDVGSRKYNVFKLRRILDKDLGTPPGGPALHDRYIVPAGAVGAWAGLTDRIVRWNGSAWVSEVPVAGALVRVVDEALTYEYSGSSWAPLPIGAIRTTTGPTALTVGAVADGEVLTRSGSTIVGSSAGIGDALTTDPLSQFAATTSAQLASVLSDETGTGAFVLAASPTFTGIPILADPKATTLSLTNTGLKLNDVDASHYLVIKPGTDLTADRNLVLTTGDASRTLTLTGDASISGTHTGTSSGTNTGDQTSVSGNAGTVTFADAAGDTTTNVALGTSATGNLSPATDAELTYNATTNVLTASGGFVGDLTGNASTASTATTVVDEAITIAKIADGTDGELLTWDASGEAATVAVGTSGHALTSNGAGAAPTFQEPSNTTISVAAPVETLACSTIGTTETIFGSSVTIPANTLIAGVAYRVTMGLLFTGTNVPTFNISLRQTNATGPLFFSHSLQQLGTATSAPSTMQVMIVGTGAAGAAVDTYTAHIGRAGLNISGNSGFAPQPLSAATDAAIQLFPTFDCSANTAGNSATLIFLTLEKLAP